MRIGINALFVRPGKMGGGEVYFRNLTRAQFRLDRKNSYFVFINSRYAKQFCIDADNVSVIKCNLWGTNKLFRVFWEQLIFPILLKKLNIDIVHSFSQTGLLLAPCKSIMTIHDLQHYCYPGNFSICLRLYLKLMMWLTSRRSDKVITISNNSRNDILKFLKIPSEKVNVVYESSCFGSSPVSVSESDEIPIRKKYGIDDKYILSVASMLPHKNLDGLIRAFNLISPDDARYLVLVGMKLKSFNTIREVIKSITLPETRIKLLGYVPDEDLPALYSMAELFVFPSFFEGFGLPPLEAMTFGCPVVASNSSSIPEILGDAALFVNPFDYKDIAEKMDGLLKDEACQRTLVQKGYKRIKSFSWEKTAKEVLDIYEDITDKCD